MTIRPDIDVESAPFWAALRDHRIVAQRCTNCATVRFPARPVCAVCASTVSEWIEVTGGSHLVSWCVVRHPFHPDYQDLPYAVLLVELDEYPGVVLYGNFHGDPDTLAAGMPLAPVFDDIDDELTLLDWRPS
jgi:uncharacterized OB-fold protein